MCRKMFSNKSPNQTKRQSLLRMKKKNTVKTMALYTQKTSEIFLFLYKGKVELNTRCAQISNQKIKEKL